MNPVWSDTFGLVALKDERHPLTGARHFWTANNPASSQILAGGAIRYYTPLQFVILGFGKFLVHHPEEALSMSEVHYRLKEIETRYPNFLGEALNTEYFSLSRITQVLYELVRERINIFHIKGVLEQLAGYSSSYGSALVKEDEFDLDDIVSYIRRTDRRKLLQKYLSARGRVKVIEMSDQLQDLFVSQGEANGADFLMQPDDGFQRLLKSLQYQFDLVRDGGQLPVCLLCPSELRFRVGRFLRELDGNMPVISREELDASLSMEIVGVW